MGQPALIAAAGAGGALLALLLFSPRGRSVTFAVLGLVIGVACALAGLALAAVEMGWLPAYRETVWGVAAYVFGLVLYLAPTVVAVDRNHPRRAAIGALNVLLGWTVVGWIGALVWALTTPERSVQKA